MVTFGEAADKHTSSVVLERMHVWGGENDVFCLAMCFCQHGNNSLGCHYYFVECLWRLDNSNIISRKAAPLHIRSAELHA